VDDGSVLVQDKGIVPRRPEAGSLPCPETYEARNEDPSSYQEASKKEAATNS
jgi:hypothetical protein